MKAVGKYIIIQSQEEHTVKTKGGLILGENQREDIRYREGVVIKPGDEVKVLKEGWITVWRKRNRTTQKYNLYKISFKGKQLVARIYRIMLEEEEIPTTERSNLIMKRNSYTDKVLSVAITKMNKHT